MTFNAQFNVTNAKFMLGEAPKDFDWVRFDSNNNCNLHCVYCHNKRSDDLMEPEVLTEFLESNVLSMDNFQVGCVMEPTLDKRMVEFIEIAGSSLSRPTKCLMLQTNGVLLHTHDWDRIREAGLTHLSVSIDTAHEDTFKLLRGGAKLSKILRNLENFLKVCPDVFVQFISTVNSANVDEMAELVQVGRELGAQKFVMREMFFDPTNRIVNHEDMRQLILPQGRFAKMTKKLKKQFGEEIDFYFMASESVVGYTEAVRDVSFPTTRPRQLLQLEKPASGKERILETVLSIFKP